MDKMKAKFGQNSKNALGACVCGINFLDRLFGSTSLLVFALHKNSLQHRSHVGDSYFKNHVFCNFSELFVSVKWLQYSKNANDYWIKRKCEAGEAKSTTFWRTDYNEPDHVLNHAECKCDFDNCNTQKSVSQDRCGTVFNSFLVSFMKPEIVMILCASLLLVTVVIVDLCWFVPKLKIANRMRWR